MLVVFSKIELERFHNFFITFFITYTMFKVIMQKHVIHDTSWWEVWYAKHCFAYHWEHNNVKLFVRLGIFRHYCVLILEFFQTSSNQGV